MSEKKRPGRFTLQFYLEDPQQRMVSDLLERQGRRKAQFLTSAVLCYMQQSQAHENELPAVNEIMLEKMLVSILQKNPQLAAMAAAHSPVPEISRDADPIEEWDASLEEDALTAITETLAAFNRG